LHIPSSSFRSAVFGIFVLASSGSVALADPSSGSAAPTQVSTGGLRSAAINSSPNAAPADSNPPSGSASPIAIGTLYGLTVPLYTPEFFRVSNGNLQRVRGATASDYVQPAVYVLPSVAIWTRSKLVRKPQTTVAVMKKQWDHQPLTDDDYDYSLSGTTLSLILPAGLTSTSTNGTAVSVGLGLAYGHSIGAAAELGIALAVVWNETTYLSDAQRGAIGMPVGGMTGISDQLDTRLRPSLAIGLYLTPTF
jgi:hypothetical protein